VNIKLSLQLHAEFLATSPVTLLTKGSEFAGAELVALRHQI